MKLSNIHFSRPRARYELFIESLLVENQIDYLTRKYADVDPALIQQAVELDRKNAEKLIFGLQKGVISQIGPESLAAVADLDPFAKISNKSEAEIAYDQAIKDAKAINPKYWQWIIRTKKLNPEAQFDESIFHYLEAEGLTSEQIIDKSLDEINQASAAWHDEQFKNQESGGTYSLTPEKDAVLTIGAFAWVPVNEIDQRVEGQKMQNCIGTYCKVSDVTKIFSLRNKYNNPHISISVKKEMAGILPGWRISEIKGKQNKPPIAKYVPYALQMCEYLFKKNVYLTNSYDFWNLDSPDLYKYIKYYKGFTDHLPSKMINLMSDDELNDMVGRLGVSANFPEREDSSIVSRLTADTIYKLLSSRNANNDKLIKVAIAQGQLDEQNVVKIIEQFGATRTIEMLVKARFRPQQFMSDLKKVHPEDLLRAFDNYSDAISAFQGYDAYFGQLLDAIIKSSAFVARVGTKVSIPIISKIPTDLLMQYNTTDTMPKDSVTYHCIITELLNRAISSSDSNNIINVLKVVPSDYSFDSSSIDPRPTDVILAADYEDIPRLYEAGQHNHAFKLAIERFMNLQSLGSVLPGTTQEVAQAAQAIMNTDDVNALDDIRRTTKSRGIKVMANRKIARINRMKSNA